MKKMTEILIRLWPLSKMNWSTSQKIKLALMAFVAVMMLYPSMLSSRTVSSDSNPARPGAGRIDLPDNPNLILFKRGAFDTRAGRDLDTASLETVQSDQLSAMSQAARKQMRIVQFAGPIKRKWDCAGGVA